MAAGLSAGAVALIGAGVGAAGSMYAANQAGGAAQGASSAQTMQAVAGMQQQQSQFNRVQNLLAPYVQAGSSTFDGAAYLAANPDVAADPYYANNPEEHYMQHGKAEGRAAPMTKPGALQGQQDLLGLNGSGAQQSAISGIENSPYFSGLVKQGENAILQNASATGGLRGGNTQAALAQFRPNMLSAAIDQQYQRLGGLTTLGQNAAAGVGNAGQNMANNNSSLLGQIGSAQAGGILGQARANVQGINGLTSAFGAAMPTLLNQAAPQVGISGGAPTAGTPYTTGVSLNNNFGGTPTYF